jgi:hypothetical protein
MGRLFTKIVGTVNVKASAGPRRGDHSRRLAAFKAATTNSAILGSLESREPATFKTLMPFVRMKAASSCPGVFFDPPESGALMLKIAVPLESMRFCSVLRE